MFLPDDHKLPSSSSDNYFKPAEGENKVRILSSPIIGWEDWDNKKPVRFKYAQKPLSSFDASKPVKYFWAMIVWNYKEEKIQIWSITQSSIYKRLESLSRDSDWGAPFFYDIKIFKSGKEKDTKYDINPTPHKDVHPYLIEQFNEKRCRLEALFENGDPFATWPTYTRGVFTREDAIVKPAQATDDRYITLDQAQQLKDTLFDDNNTDEALKLLLQKCSCSSLENIASHKFGQASHWLHKRISDQKAVNINEVPF